LAPGIDPTQMTMTIRQKYFARALALAFLACGLAIALAQGQRTPKTFRTGRSSMA
jgi:hypothetical protein